MEERVQAHLQEVERRVASQLADRQKIEDAVPLSEGQLRKMDSTLKRTTAFMKKLKNLGSVQHTSILQDIEKVSFLGFHSFSLVDGVLAYL